MSRERLEEIKKSFNFWMKEDESIGLLPEDIEWLIAQAELGISQQEQFHDYQTQNLRLQERLDKSEDKLQELRKRYLTLTKENNQVNDELIDEFRKNKRYRNLLEKIDYLLEKAGEADENVYDLISYIRTLIDLEGEE